MESATPGVVDSLVAEMIRLICTWGTALLQAPPRWMRVSGGAIASPQSCKVNTPGRPTAMDLAFAFVCSHLVYFHSLPFPCLVVLCGPRGKSWEPTGRTRGSYSPSPCHDSAPWNTCDDAPVASVLNACPSHTSPVAVGLHLAS